ncbi:helix-turn-helix domain-containing protein [Dyadobacter subterraneus]|uniref:Helix-turn-helix transcriptional regulator n=1 Tax=Dyadobacter subterraneus TaxID=2773304 RepID=A0ABR9WBC4_9BACT|nr:AraC family transcriptional regulator [Dyadobacter subterraneus]MBE9462708.1 helix-turn-helix transcriptional regulator [Dyadobacter subterraneus]
MENTDFKSTFSLLNADYVQLNKNWNYRNVISPFYRIYLIDEGIGSLGDADRAHVLEQGYLYMVPSFTLCNHHCPKYLSQFYIHVLEESADGTSLFSSNRKIHKIESIPEDIIRFKKILHLNPGRDLRRTDNPREYEKQPSLAGFQKRNNLIPLSDYIETKGLILEMIARFLKSDSFKSSETKKIPSVILDSVNYILTNLQSNITVEHLSERACYNANYFSRIFTNYTGERPLAYIQKKRIERAQYLIITTQLSLSEIAVETGFESLSYFSRTFKDITGQTPTQYKKINNVV